MGKDNAWSTEIDHHNDSDDDDRHTERGGRQEEDEYALLHSTETDEGRHPGRPLNWGEDRFRESTARPYAAYDSNVDTLSPGGYEEYRRAAQAPEVAAPYGSGGQGYTGGGQGYSFDRV